MSDPFDLDPAAWMSLRALLDEALRLPPHEREAWINRLDDEHARLKPRLRALLAHVPALHDSTDDVATAARAPSPRDARANGARLGEAAAVAARLINTLPKIETGQFAPMPADARPDQRVGPYRLLHTLGEGGMASVWLAERTDVLQSRRVALKLPHGAWRRAGLVERMQREREILATLNHPNIATLYDAGVDDAGRPWLALEFVEGERIDAYAGRMKLDIPARLGLVLQVAQAVAHAHAKLVVHRDLKPGNILVTTEGRVKLLDFGIAKLLEDEAPAPETALTLQVGRALTPDYAAPEQILGRPVGTAADVYALGVVLYELLTGVRPHAQSGGPRGALEAAAAGASAPPASIAAAERGTAWQRALKGDLDTIVAKAMKADPDERYATVQALADDVERHVNGEPVRAQPDRVGYRMRKFVGRHRVGVALAGVALAAVLAGSGMAVRQTIEAREQAALARSEAASAERAQAFLEEMIESAIPERAQGREVTVRDMVDRAARQLVDDPPADALLRARMKGAVGYSLHRLGESRDARRLVEQAVDEARALGAPAQRALALALLQLGNIEHRTDEASAAETHLREALAIKRRIGETDDAVYAKTANELGLVLRARAPKEALELFQQLRAELVARHGEVHEGPITLLANIGSQQMRLFDYGAAKDTLERALPLVRKGLGETHPLVGVVLSNLAQTERRLGHHDRAAALQREDLALSRQVQGPRHPDVGISWLGLAQILVEQGQAVQALAALDEALPILKDALGARHGRVLLTMGTQAQALAMAGRSAEARQVLSDALASPAQGPEARVSQAWLRLRDAELDRHDGLHAQALAKADALRLDEVAARDRNIVALAHVTSACALVAMGLPERAQDHVDQGAAVRREHANALPWSIHTDAARVAACRGRNDDAAAALRQARGAGFADRSLLAEPDFAGLRSDPALAALRPVSALAD